ncbi:MAG TPA: sugar phosphate isomerase/epimerase family protein [Anaerolineales bacterium]|nr:sugar phosphate isomerase/epimerase family protein [Anaerolineales bacterium]
MHLSMHNWMRAEPVDVTVRRLAKYGYKSIEISGEPYLYNTKDVRKTLKDNGIRCWGSVTLMLGDRNLVAKNEAQRAKSVQYTKDCITMVKELEGYEMTIVPATVGKISPDGPPDEEWKWAVESLKECYDWGKKEGVVLAVEPINRFETYFCFHAAQAIALAKATGPDCGVCLDAFHLNIEEADPYESIRWAKGLLTDFHVADTNRFACGQGHWDWAKLVSTLKEIGYDGALTVEFVAPVDRTPANKYPDAIEKNPVDITPEQRKFIEDHGSSLLTEEFYSWQVEECSKTLLPLIS